MDRGRNQRTIREPLTVLNIYVYAAQPEQANKAVEQLRVAGADQVEVLAELKIPARPPKENRYLFICETPAQKLAQLAPTVLPEEDYVQAMSEWFDTHYQIIQTVTAHKKRSILIPKNQLATTSTLVEAINSQWALNLTDVNKDTATQKQPTQPEPLLGYLVQNLIEQTPPLKVLENQINALAGINVEPLHEIDALNGYRVVLQQQSELITENQRFATETTELGNQLKDQRDESKLLLLQLHQAQEELEKYFLKKQETEAKITKQEARWIRLLETHPDYIDAESVDVEVVDINTQNLKWVIQGLEGQCVSKDYLEFETFVESGVLGIRFNKTNSRNELNLNIWPASCHGERLECIPAGSGNVRKQRATTLMDLSATDWKLLNVLPYIIKEHISMCKINSSILSRISESIDKFESGIKTLPKTFRYDSANLKGNKVNRDYEHLWFVFNNCSFDEKYWTKFEIRLGAADVVSCSFSKHPKLEIPLIDGKTKPFDSWFEESNDEFGAKWELRFDIDKYILDKSVWARLSKGEKDLIHQLSRSISIICRSSANNTKVYGHTWSDWTTLCSECLKIISNEILADLN